MKTKSFNSYLSLGCLLLFFGISDLQSQDVQFSQFYSNVVYLNPAFAGSAHSTRVMFHQRIQWPSLDARYITSYTGVDHYFSKNSSGLGISFMKDWQGQSHLTSTEVSVQYAYEVHLNSDLSLRAGLQGTYATRNIDYSVLTFPDQYSGRGFSGQNSNEPQGNSQISYPDIASGAILYTDHAWIGISSHHMNSPRQDLYDRESKLPIKTAFVGGYKFKLSEKMNNMERYGTDFSIVPSFHYKFQGKSDQLDLGIYSLYNSIIAGFWYRGIPVKNYSRELPNNESIIFLAGFKYYQISIGYSYDFSVSKLTNMRTGGSHELNITYIFDKPQKRKRPVKKLPCPHFYKKM